VFLKSLTLKGFKSFADSCTLEFEPGVTVVVGPNGSGKSNIVDAVAWVLGAQGPRSLRSSKMEDVIFAGTSKRPALGRAEVSLVIDNSAGLLPIELSEVRITRALWRSGESEYSINGAPCRLLDVQELLSDTGVGRQQHTIISQAQLDSILSARPEDRRAVIEEAAGIAKHRRRKEKAERRLEATEGALLRAQDLLREVRRQLRPLERQADAARRHAGLQEELTALRRYLYGRDWEAVSAHLQAVQAKKAELRRSVEAAERSLARFDKAVSTAEAELDQRRKQAAAADIGEAISGAEALRGRANALLALVHERRRSVERERGAAVDQDLVASLEAEAASLSSDIQAACREAAELMPLEQELRDKESELGRARAELSRRASPEGSRQRAAEVRAELGALRQRAAATALGNVEAQLEVAAARSKRLREEAACAEEALAAARSRERELEQAVQAAAERVRAARSHLEAAEAAKAQAEAVKWGLAARVETLAQALDEARARAGARRLADVEGMVGALAELVKVEPGLEAAFEAAAGEALAAVVMADEGSALAALAHLAEQDAAGAVIALRPKHQSSPNGGTGAARLATSPLEACGEGLNGLLPSGATWLRSLVHSVEEPVEELLDRLLGNAVVVEGGWSEAVGLARERPELVVVTRSGERFAGGIWRTGAHGTGATGAALAEAKAALGQASVASDVAERTEQDARACLEEAEAAHAEARRAQQANASASRAASEALGRLSRDIAEAGEVESALLAQRAELSSREEADRARAEELGALVAELEAAAAAEEQEAIRLAEARSHLEQQAAAVATLRHDLEVRATAIEERKAVLERRLAEVERRLERHSAGREEASRRRSRLEVASVALERLDTYLEQRVWVLGGSLERLRELRRAELEALGQATDELEALRRSRAGEERRLLGLSEELARTEGEEGQLVARMEALREAVRRDLDCEVEQLVGAQCPALPAGTSPASRVRELERELRALGPVNPLALEEYAALQGRHEFLEHQLHDVTSARRELAKVIRAVDAEIVAVFKAAYDDVAENFENLAATLFPGGQGKLMLLDPSNILESGVDLEVRPAGKKVNRLSLLSGGERSLVALAFLFAVFRSRPSPFYMLDEVEAALDDVSLQRFLGLVDDFRSEAQLLIVTHQKRTMEAADCLYGVSMAPGGSSVVVSQRLERAEAVAGS
jgi:chromosome segregation protein